MSTASIFISSSALHLPWPGGRPLLLHVTEHVHYRDGSLDNFTNNQLGRPVGNELKWHYDHFSPWHHLPLSQAGQEAEILLSYYCRKCIISGSWQSRIHTIKKATVVCGSSVYDLTRSGRQAIKKFVYTKL